MSLLRKIFFLKIWIRKAKRSSARVMHELAIDFLRKKPWIAFRKSPLPNWPNLPGSRQWLCRYIGLPEVWPATHNLLDVLETKPPCIDLRRSLKKNSPGLTGGHLWQPVKKNSKWIAETGGIVLTSWISNLPGETASEFQQTQEIMHTVVKSGGFIYWIENLHVLPGSKLYKKPDQSQTGCKGNGP